MSRAVSNRNAPVWVAILLLAVGVVAVVLAVIYFSSTAGQLPSYLPGHQAGSSHHHTKHAVVATGLAVVALIGAWLSSGKKHGR